MELKIRYPERTPFKLDQQSIYGNATGRTLDTRHWTLDIGHEHWTLDTGHGNAGNGLDKDISTHMCMQIQIQLIHIKRFRLNFNFHMASVVYSRLTASAVDQSSN
ncbi:unnamed protein product [Ambrosiozyma monospora]|uniref:Unnamed protein product n=1 Tax=Ambrosiozyma monospora TaxID=43982 RepID=A0A9W6YVE1_AMBMO|nr:unnamed protein product [Ambrosiozyma monospora]